MSAANGSAIPTDAVTDFKGKGKAAQQPQAPNQDMSMDEDEDSSEGESGNEEPAVEAEEDADEDNMEEIDTSNILGRRTRGKMIDYEDAAQKAKEAGDTLEDDDEEEEDEDFEEAEAQGNADNMEE